jgi:hypothetical protein
MTRVATPRRRAAATVHLRGLVLVALLAATLAGCGRGSSDVSGVNAADLLQRAATRMAGVTSLRFDLEQQNGAAEILNGLAMTRAKGAVAGPNRLSIEADVSAGPLNATVKIIVLPDQSWVTNPLTGRWEKQDVQIAPFFDPTTGVPGLMRSVTNPKVTGTATVDGHRTYVVEAVVDSGALSLFSTGAPSGKKLQARAWIGVDDPLVYRIEVVGGISASEPSNLVRTLTLSDLGAAIDIQPPRP